MTNATQKGKRLEREACKLLESMGFRAMRSAQNSGVADDEHSADILTDVPGIRFEIKGGYNDLKITHKKFKEWIQKAENECGEGYDWMILWKKNRNDWTAIASLGGMVVRTPDVEELIDRKKDDEGSINWPGQ